MRPFAFSLVIFSVLFTLIALAKDITTNELTISGAPDWLKQSRVERVTASIQSKLEWTIRRIPITWHSSQDSFEKAHKFGAMALAVTKNGGGSATMHIGPSVVDTNFDEIFGHELVHVIVIQKYKAAIPKWLEEGLANHLAKRGKVDYKWLAQQPFPTDVRDLAHPFSGSAEGVVYRYKASQALAEMLDKKCGLDNLIRLSVERKMEDYIKRYCEIPDLNKAFHDWVKARSRS